MAGNRVPYIIDLIVSDTKLRESMAKLKWEDILGSKGKEFGKTLASGVKDSEQEIRSTLSRIDWTSLLGEKQIKALQQSVARVFQKNKQEIDKLLNADPKQLETGLHNIIVEVSNLISALGDIDAPLEGWGKNAPRMIQSFDSLMTRIDSIEEKTTSLKLNIEGLNTQFETLTSRNALEGIANEAHEAEVAVARMAKTINQGSQIDDAAKHLQVTLSALKKAAREASFPEIKINYDLNDDELKTKLDKLNDAKSDSLETSLSYRMGDLFAGYDEVLESLNGLTEGTGEYKTASAKLVPILKEMLMVEQRLQKIDNRTIPSLIKQYGDELDTDIFDSGNNMRAAIKEIMDALNAEIDVTKEKLKNLTLDWRDELSSINLKLALSKEDETEFKKVIDQYVTKLNDGAYGKLQNVKIGLSFNEADSSKQDAALKSSTAEQIAERKQKLIDEQKDFNERIQKLEEELNNNINTLNNEGTSTYQHGKLTKRNKEIEAEINSLKKNIVEYQYVVEHMDDDDFGAVTTTTWRKFDAVEKSLTTQQARILNRTREWRDEMTKNLSFNFKWTPFTDEQEFTDEVNKINAFTGNHPINLVPDMETFMTDIQDALDNNEFVVHITPDGPIPVAGVMSGGYNGPAPIIGQYITPPPPPAPPTPPSPPTSDGNDDVEPMIEQAETEIESDIQAIVQFARNYKNRMDAANQKLIDLLEGTGLGIGSKRDEFKEYFDALKDGSVKLPDAQSKKYNNVNTYIDSVKNAIQNATSVSQYFDDAVKYILDNADNIAEHPELADAIKNILVDSIAKSISGYEASITKQRAQNNRRINIETTKYENAMKAYGSTEEKDKRAKAINDAQAEIDTMLNSNEILSDYYEIRSNIDALNKKSDKKSKEELQVYKELEQEYLPSVRAQYDELIKLIEKRNQLLREDPNDPYLKAATEAQANIRSAKNRNSNIDRRLGAYSSVGIQMLDSEQFGPGLFSLIRSGDQNAIRDYILSNILNKSDIVDRMSRGRKFSEASTPTYMFATSGQQIVTGTIDLVQHIFGLVQQTAKETAKRAQAEDLFKHIKDLTYKGKTLRTLRDNRIPDQQVFETAKSMFASDIESAKNKQQSDRNDRDKAYIALGKVLDKYAKAANDFGEIYSSFDKDTVISFAKEVDSQKWFAAKITEIYNALPDGSDIKKKINDMFGINSNTDILEQFKSTLLLRMKFSDDDLQDPSMSMIAYWKDAAQKAQALDSIKNDFVSIIRGQKEDKSKNQPYKYGILTDDIAKEAQKYVFRVVVTDDKGNRNTIVYNRNKRGRYQRIAGQNVNPQGTYAYDLFDKIPDDLSNIDEINFFEAPGMKPVDVTDRFTEETGFITPMVDKAKKVGHQFYKKTQGLIKHITGVEDKADSANDMPQYQSLSELESDLNNSITNLETSITNIEEQITTARSVTDENQAKYIEASKKSAKADKELRAFQNDSSVAEWEKDKQKSEKQRSLRASLPSTTEYDTAINELDSVSTTLENARKILEHPTDTSLWTLVDEVPECVKQLVSLIEEENTLKNTSWITYEDLNKANTRLQEISAQKQEARNNIAQWYQGIESNSKQQETIARQHITEAMPKLLEQYQNKIISLISEASDINQQLSTNPQNAGELKKQLSEVSEKIIFIFDKYKKYLDTYNITIDGTLGNSSSKYIEDINQMMQKPKKIDSYKINGIEQTDLVNIFNRRYEIFEEDTTLWKQFENASEEDKKRITARRQELKQMMQKAETDIQSWISNNLSAPISNIGIFSGFNLGGLVSDNILKVITDGSLSTNNAKDAAKAAASAASDELKIAEQKKQESDRELQNKESLLQVQQNLLEISKQQLEIGRQLFTVQDESQKQELAAKYKALSNEAERVKAGKEYVPVVGTNPRPRSQDVSLTAEELQQAAWKVINAALDDIEASTEELQEIDNQKSNAQRRLRYLKAKKEPGELKNHYQRQAIDSAINSAIEERITKAIQDFKDNNYKPNSEDTDLIYGVIDQLEDDLGERDYRNPSNWDKALFSRAKSAFRNQYIMLAEDEFAYVDFKTEEDRRRAISDRATKLLKSSFSINEENILNKAIQAQQSAIDALNERRKTEVAYINTMNEEKKKAMEKAGITQEQIDAQRASAEATRQETKVVRKKVGQESANPATPPSQLGGNVPLDTTNPSDNGMRYSNYVGNSTSGYYQIDVSDLAKDSTVKEILKILGGNTSTLDNAEWERKQARIKELEAKGPSGNGGLGRREDDLTLIQQIMSEGMEKRIERANALSKAGIKVGRGRLLLNSDEAFDQMLNGDTPKNVVQNLIWPKIVQQLKAAGLNSTEEFNNILSSIQNNSVWKSKKGTAWIHFATEGDKFNSPITKKAYGSFSDLGKISKDLINSILNELVSKGFKGQIKIPDDITGFYNTDQIVGHAADDNSFRILIDVFKKFADSGILSSVATGVDANTQVLGAKNGASFTQLIEEIYEAAPGQVFTVEEIKSIIKSIVTDKSGKFGQELVKPIVDNLIAQRITPPQTPEKPNTTTNTIKRATFANGQTLEGTEEEIAGAVAVLGYGEPIKIETIIEPSIQPGAVAEKVEENAEETPPQAPVEPVAENEKKEPPTQVGRTPAEEAEYQRLLAETAGGPPSNNDNTTNGGLIQIVNDLAKQDTLLKVLSALQEIAKMQSGTPGVNAAGDLYKQLKALLLGGSIDDHERLAYMNLETGVLSADVIGTRSQVNQDLINQLRAKYSVNDGFNTQIHSHGQSDIPYFSNQDYDAFVKDYQDGIKKQVLLTKDSITVLDLTAVQSVEQVQSLMDSLKKAGTDAKAVQDALEKTGAGATYNNRKFDELNANSLVKMLGIKGIESRYSESETREMARKGVADEAAKEAANILQESTGRAIKKTVERVGLELETTTERTDVKGNKVWTSEISNKYKKAMKATNDKIMEQNLEQVFGTDTEAFNALQEYTAQYNKLVDLANKFDANPKDDSLQKEINDTLPLLDKAEEKLISLINRKNKFIDSKETVGTFSQSELGDAKTNLHNLAISRYSGKNIAFNGLRGTNNGVELLVDVLEDDTIKQYALEVDKTTGQVRELMVSENALANALQNVNQVMRQNEIVQAKVAIGDNPTQQEQFMQAAQSKEWNAYKSALNELEKYVADKWAKIQKNIQTGKGKTTFSQKELDYIMALSEKVLALGKAVQNTSIVFKNFWAQNPDDVQAFDIKIKKRGNNVLSRDEQVRGAMENYAKVNAEANASRYDFVSFDNDILKYKLTDIEGNVRNVTLVWNELYKQIAFVSDKSVSALDPLVAKIQQYDEVINQAKNDHYLLADDDSLTAYESIKTKIDEIIESIKSSGTYTEEQIAELDKLRKSAIDAGANVNKTINKNKKLYTGTNELNAVNRQRNKIIGTYSVDILSDEQNKAIKNYVDAYKNLNNTYNDYVTNHKISDPEIQKQLAQQAIGVQNLGKELIQTLTKEEKLTQLVQQSGSFKDKQGITHNLGRSYQLTDAEMKDLSQTMLVYAQKAVGSAAIESKKFDAVHQKMILTVRTSKNEVADLTAEVIDDTKKMYLYQTQARESLTGFDAFKRDFKAKLTSIGAYLASMTSIYKVWNTLQQGVQYVREIDSALTELKKVTDETEESYDRFLQTASKTADKVGSTIKEIVSSTADWARLGYSMEDAASLAESTSVLLNVSEFSSIDDATSALISTMQAFDYAAKDSMHVVDVMNEIGKFIACR